MSVFCTAQTNTAHVGVHLFIFTSKDKKIYTEKIQQRNILMINLMRQRKVVGQSAKKESPPSSKKIDK